MPIDLARDNNLRFALEGLGAPAPIAPTQHLVVTGFYRRVRNPMYVGSKARTLARVRKRYRRRSRVRPDGPFQASQSHSRNRAIGFGPW
jgi:hypothetical protein